MFREKAVKLLKKLQETNFKPITDRERQRLDFIDQVIDAESKKIIESIVNECKSTVFIRYENRVTAIRYESPVTIQAVGDIVRKLLENSPIIPRETVRRILFIDGESVGLDTDIILYKGINSETAKTEATISRIIVDESEIKVPNIKIALEEIYKKYAIEIILDPKSRGYLPTIDEIRLENERSSHKEYTKDMFIKDYIEFLEKFSGISNKEMIKQSARYKVDHITSEKFRNGVLESIRNGTAITFLDNEEIDEFKKLQNQIAGEIYEQLFKIKNLNALQHDIHQIFKDIEAQLTAYAMDFRNHSPEQIEEQIKEINRLSLVQEKAKYLGEHGYKSVDNKIDETGKIKLTKAKDVQMAMEKYAEAVYSFLNSASELNNKDYLIRATMLMYRFIRIHPFPDSNGRTSRAILNALMLNRNILVSFTKEHKQEFIKISNLIHNRLGEDYINALCQNPEMASGMEKENIGELVDFIKSHSTMCVQGTTNANIRRTFLENTKQQEVGG